MNKILLCWAMLLGCSPVCAQKGSYIFVEVWTGENSHSSAPLPSCTFDLDPNRREIPEDSTDEQSPNNICYDEFIPEGSQGWVHAVVYKFTVN